MAMFKIIMQVIYFSLKNKTFFIHNLHMTFVICPNVYISLASVRLVEVENLD